MNSQTPQIFKYNYKNITISGLPGSGSTTLLDMLREELKLDIPIIALTANALEGDKEKFLKIGMNDYLAKPLEITNMDRVLKKYRPLK